MYDTLNLWLPRERMPNTNILNIENYITDIQERYKADTKQLFVSGRLGNLNVMLCESGISIKGSICKYYLGQNFKTLSRGDTERAIIKLSDEIHLPVSLAKVTRIDIAQNLILKYDLGLYLNSLGYCQYYSRLEQNNGLYYDNSKRTKLFYGKVHEQKIKGEVIPELYLDKNVLRYELRYKNRLPEVFNCSEVSASLLCEEKFYYNLGSQWEKEYFSINKNKKFSLDFEVMKSLKMFEDQIYLAGLKALYGGEKEALEVVKMAKSIGVFDNKMQHQRLKEKIKKVCNLPVLTNESEPIEELNQKVREVIKFCR